MTTNATAGPEESRAGRAPRTLLELIVNQTDPTAVIARIRQMADYWEQHLPEVIRTPAVVSALRAALEAVPAVVSPPTDRAADEVDADTVASRAAQVITNMGADIRALTGQRDRYRTAWRSARERAQAHAEGTLRHVADRDFWKRQHKAEHARHVAVVGALVTDRAAVHAETLEKAADALPDADLPFVSPMGRRQTAEWLRRLAVEAHSAGAQQLEAHPPEHAWRVETRDGEWVRGSHFLHRQAAVERYETANSTAPLWQDGTPIERRIVRETTTYTVEEPAPVAQQTAAADDEETQS